MSATRSVIQFLVSSVLSFYICRCILDQSNKGVNEKNEMKMKNEKMKMKNEIGKGNIKHNKVTIKICLVQVKFSVPIYIIRILTLHLILR